MEHLLDSLWRIAAAILVLSMQVGFLLLESGSVRERNTVNVAQKNTADIAVCWVLFLLFGYTLAFGIPTPLWTDQSDIASFADFLFQLGFCGATVTIVSGAVAERMKFVGYLAIAVVMAGFIYPLVAAGAWGNLFSDAHPAPLANLGFVDFAGGTVVHGVAGAVSLAAVLIIGSRSGRFNEDGSVNPMPGHSPVMQMAGALLLIIGWLGFNGGSLAPTDPAFGTTLLNTATAAAFGALTGLVLGAWLDHGVFNPGRTVNGSLGGLVAVTACAGFASVAASVALGIAGAALALLGAHWLTYRCKIDDPLDVVAVHGLCGLFGTLCVAATLPAEQLIMGSRWTQLGIQGVIGGGTLLTVFLISLIGLYLANRVFPLRVTRDDEMLGLNNTEHGVTLDSTALRAALHSSIDDSGSFASHAQIKVEDNAEMPELAVAMDRLLDKHEEARRTMLRQSVRFEQFAAATNDRLWETDHTGALTEIIGSNKLFDDDTIQTFRGKFIFNAFEAKADQRSEALELLRQKRPLENIEVRCFVQEQERVCVLQVCGIPFNNDEGEFAGYRGGASDLTEQVLAQERALYLANHDQLTGLLNRHALEKRLLEITDDAPVGIALLDLDDFKLVNDQWGHHKGDLLLAEIAHRIERSVRSEDVVYRVGGDEFVILLEGLKADMIREEAMRWGNRLVEDISQPLEIEGITLNVGASVGVSIFPEDGHGLGDLLRLADLALYNAKSKGKGQVIAFERAMHDIAHEERNIRLELQNAIENEEFFLVYQPKLDLITQALNGAEALLRWRHPKRGVLAPDAFLASLEQMGHMPEVGAWVLEEACREAASWDNPSLHIAVNVAPIQLIDPAFVGTVEQAIRESGLAPCQLELELVEEALLTSDAQTQEVLNKLRSLDVGIAIDDFGCGSTSLRYLHRLPVTKLKIDKSFIRNLLRDGRAREIARSIAQLGKDLGLHVTAEGVEDERQVDQLAKWDCDEVQGYLISRPLERDQFAEQWLKRPPEAERQENV